MLQVARLAPKALGEASRQVLAYLQDQVTEDGGFADRRATAISITQSSASKG